MNRPELKGLYCITDPELTTQSPLNIEEMVQLAIKGGARVIQYRDKHATQGQQIETADRLRKLCKQSSVIFLINDDPQLAKTVDADGVHLGQTDTGLQEARQILGETKIIGITCHDRLDLAIKAEQQGADYVAFGRFFPSSTKPAASPASIDLLPVARANLQIPIVAIGGITAGNAQSLLNAGADLLAVIHAVFGYSDIRQAASTFACLMDSPQGS